ncbi:MAG: long-chain fatty acid--CoA ligase [Thermoflexus sp.]|jgi:fatty-acyl-CoA synthase|uniref:long-chain fatty acid--CoA ligase n=1 Tax=Thermoflexus TaxID=1495649 RepID=UPI001C73FC23|nr:MULTISPECIES: long-chain fatty acid--CoA ligase [Thermoflexus]MDT7883984.1 long-chain fatty acid--CoA ligase [Thermoflexus sp.]MDT7947558.1 long-chain fatty acid--CoA ligase [Thermoflexus sp.]QWK09423.1 MAG: long-chain fatty acid--CoA ligase [Thermoflexus hugenholtzii]
MEGLMMDWPLTLHHFLDRAARLFPRKEIATRTAAGMHRYTYADFHRRVHRLAHALTRLGIGRGDRVATFAWNTYRHLEIYFAAPCMGAVLHTLNIRLAPDQLIYIINHAEDRVIFVDASLVPLLERIRDQIPTVKAFVIMSDTGPVQTSLSPALDYEALLAESPEAPYPWPRLDENAAAGMCYTSGTTGNPKGVVYSHRAIFLHSMALCLADTFGICERDVLMPVVPMFHANAWGMPFAGVMVGAKLVFPGPHLQPRDIAELIQNERVTVTAGVPTIWIGLYALLERERYDLSSLRVMPVGGSAMPRALIEAFEKRFGIRIAHAWGMTEMTPLGTVANLKSYMESWPDEERFAVRAKQGMPVVGVEIRAVDEQGREVPWDGKTMGELQVRGPWVIRAYYNDPRTAEAFQDGWFRTGDVVTIDPEGYIQIVDRTKDLIKSGGEWISSVDLENALMAHPKVLEAAVIAVPHPKWQERPLAVVVPRPEFKEDLTKEELLEFLRPRFAKWWLPDDIVFVEAIPKTSVGKFDKKVLREQFKDYRLPETPA